MKCETCRWFVLGTNDEGECHRYAPRKTHGVGTGEVSTLWPMLSKNNGCGDYEYIPDCNKSPLFIYRDGIYDEAAEMSWTAPISS